MSEKVFVRKVSGVVKTMNTRDSIYYGYLAGAALYAIVTSYVWGPYMFPGGNLWIAILLDGVFGTIIMVAYGMLASAMPRSGGDYVFQSRVVSGALGFATVQSNLGIWNMFYSYWAAMTLIYGVAAPFASYAGVVYNSPSLLSLGSWLTNAWVVAGFAIALILISTLIMLRGMGPFLKIQRWFMAPATLLSLVVLAALILTCSHSQYVSNFDAITTGFKPPPAGGWFASIIPMATSQGYNPNVGFNWWDTIGLAAMLSPGFYYCGVTVALLGEIKGAESLKTSVSILVWALEITVVTCIICYASIVQIIGMPWISSLGYLSLNHPEMLPFPAFVYLPAPGFLIMSFLSQNPIVALLIALGIIGITSQSLFNSPIGATRVIFAASMDRVLPDAMAKVNKRGAPMNLLLVQAVAIAFAVVLAFMPSLTGYWSGAMSSASVMFCATMLAAVLFPITAKGIYEVSPCFKYKLGSIPLVTVLGVLGLIYTFITGFMYFAVPGFGLSGAPLYFALGMYVFLLAIYFIGVAYRKRQGIDVRLAFKEVPPA